MVRGLYTSALGMITSMQRMDVVTNNLASVNTTGFKRNHVVSHEFSDLFLHRLNDPGVRMFGPPMIGRINPGVFVDDVFTVFDQGPLQQTGGPLDLALMGLGFFVVGSGEEEFFTRDGSFSIAPGGFLVTSAGARLQGVNGDIVIPNGEIVITDDGRVMVNDEYVDTIRLASFSNLQSLRKMENNLFRTTEESVSIPFAGTVSQGFLEGSNVNIVSEMVNMITLTRHYDTNARMVQIIDGTLQNAVNDIARR